MATNFYERQDIARRNTWWLVVMFVLAVIGIVGTTFVVTAIAFSAAGGGNGIPLEVPVGASVGALALIGGGSAYKVAQLAGGGTVVAERLGGRRVYPNTTDPIERRLLNVVEEMALASGVPVPPVFLLTEEQGLNAFAAGFSPSDAVIGITRGCAEQLTRDQLQGVIAHEFSHILNGDMRLNLRLIGVLHGILLMGLVGRELLRIASHGGGRSRRSEKNDGGAYLLLIGLTFVIVGFVGLFFGNLIKAAVSRQREFLADASAVQFTRNPEGIAGALKRIGAAVFGSKLANPRAAEASHMYFAEGISGLFATHPPLEERIRRLDPAWNGEYPPALPAGAVAERGVGETSGFVGEEARLFPKRVPVEVVERASAQVASPREIHQRYVQELVAAMPRPVVDAAHEPYGARALIYASLLDRDADIRASQLRMLEQTTEPDVFELTLHLTRPVNQLDVRARLPLVDMTLPALRALSPSQYQEFMHCFDELVRADLRIGLFEWSLHKVLLRHLRPQFEPVRPKPIVYYGLQQLAGACSCLLSALARASQHDDAVVFAAGARHLPETGVRLLPPDASGLNELENALGQLARVAPKQRARLVDACAACICADAEVKVAEGELLRAICDMLDCPMPPLIAGQKVSPSLIAPPAHSGA
ncbi:MAG: M48 family metallopeptidase [Planctomycetes bacterium]|nr:M48 family metallopeptidase [Planctomycetota bacterium]